ncbi:hypothetical protein GGH12_004317 [Coemansia sp. RSA 1822]|nr:hypothetical protein LPJ76_004311 [Coemansia sp. RSA 638]KAJ2122177.1 hypothetical protein IW147_003589 [Coemansia sp. RSA 720]KAJ2540831.1 hypothetical protein GGF49_004138 [Coemansia sp. RSA 1853]KAJ2561027.1 hypothetical protein GGH12_004317 [Coemansia sp. RSA 1822]
MSYITFECTQYTSDGEAPVWVQPHCIETDKSLEFPYGRDTVMQCSIKRSSPFHRAMQHNPLRCRIQHNSKQIEFPLRVQGHNYNAILHGEKGQLVAGTIYPVADRPLPEAVSGVTTIIFSPRWYEGSSLSVLMANKRHEEEFIISPVVAVMFCILTACVVYVVGRVYVEGSLIPRILAKQQKSE